MKVTFTKTDKRRYSVSAEGVNVDLSMATAPGYDDRLPHDVAHFIVENELGILGGVFGQIAAGGTANTFFGEAKNPRKARKRGSEIAKANKKDALFSEHAIYAAQSRWEKHDIIPATNIPDGDIERIIARFQDFADRWTKLPIGGSISLEWQHPVKTYTLKKIEVVSANDLLFERLTWFCYIIGIMTPRCISKLRPMKQRANLFAGD